MAHEGKLHPVRVIEPVTDDEGVIHYDLFIDAGGITDFDKLFARFGREPDGYEWRDVIEAWLSREHPALKEHVLFDPEGDALLMHIGTEEHQSAIAQAIYALCAEEAKLLSVLEALPPPPPKEEAKPAKKKAKKKTKKKATKKTAKRSKVKRSKKTAKRTKKTQKSAPKKKTAKKTTKRRSKTPKKKSVKRTKKKR